VQRNGIIKVGRVTFTHHTYMRLYFPDEAVDTTVPPVSQCYNKYKPTANAEGFIITVGTTVKVS